jgi:hypothetical protein
MNWSIKVVAMVLLAFAFLFGGMLSGASDVRAQEKADTLAKQVQGSWVLTSLYVEQDGKKVEPFGSEPRGSLILSPEGRFSLILMRPSLPKFAANNRIQGTAEENQAVVQGSLAEFGSYTVTSGKEPAVNLRFEACTFPNWDGQEQKRIFTIKGDEMSFTNPVASTGGVAYINWKRVK